MLSYFHNMFQLKLALHMVKHFNKMVQVNWLGVRYNSFIA